MQEESAPFHSNVSDVRFIAFDTETTGATPGSDHLVEIAAIAFDEDFEHRRFETLVKPPVAIPEAVIKIHGITDAMVASAPETAVAIEQFLDFLDWAGTPRVLLAHNAGFDVGMIHGEAKRVYARGATRAQRAHSSGPSIVINSCMLAKNLLPELKQHRLESLANHFKIETGRMHRALEDVKALYGVFMRMLGLAADRASQDGDEVTVAKLVDIAGGYFVLDPTDAGVRQKPFRLPPRIAAIESLCGGEARVSIAYEHEEDYRYISPISVTIRGFRVYIEAFCHRENIKKTFRADRIKGIGRIEQPEVPS